MIRVVIVDDQPMVREGIKHILERDSDLVTVGLAENGKEALRLCEKMQADLVLMDIMMPESDGIEGVRLIKERFPAVKVIMLSTFSDEEKVVKALNHGADGYILKDIQPEELILTVKNAAAGIGVMHKDILFHMARRLKEDSKITISPPKKIDVDLTERELAIIRLIVDGKENKEIAMILYVSEGTVKNTLSAILKKLGIGDRTQLAVFALRNGLV